MERDGKNESLWQNVQEDFTSVGGKVVDSYF